MKIEKVLAWGCLLVMFLTILTMNIQNIPSQDELAYAFNGGMSKPLPKEILRVDSVDAIIAQQIRDYTTAGGNGRVFLHGLVAFFSGFKLYLLFDVLNTLMWFLLVFLVLKNGSMQLNDKNKAIYIYIRMCRLMVGVMVCGNMFL